MDTRRFAQILWDNVPEYHLDLIDLAQELLTPDGEVLNFNVALDRAEELKAAIEQARSYAGGVEKFQSLVRAWIEPRH